MAKTFKLIFLVSFFIISFGFFGRGAQAATLSINPTSGSFEVGDRVTVRVMVGSSTPINAVSAVLAIPTSIFTIESVSKSGSILNFWVTEPSFAKGAGILQFEGVKLGGFPGGTGGVVTATLRAVNPGTGTIAFNSGQVLANDGQGTDVTSGMSNATFSVVAKKEVPVKTPAAPKPAPDPEEEIEVTEPVQPPPTLNPPHIELSEKNGLQAVLGTTDYSDAEVLVTFVSKTGVKVFISGKTDQKGEFIMLVPKTLVHGVYAVSAIVLEQRDAITYSHPSNEIEITVGSIFSDLDPGVKAGIAILFLAICYLIFRVFMYIRGNRIIRSFLERDVKNMEDVLDKSLKDLGKRSNASAIKDIEEAERLIKKELKDLDNL